MATLIEEVKPVNFVNYALEYREKLKINGFLWSFLKIRNLIQGRKTITFPIENSSTSAVFSIEIFMEATEMVVAGN